VGEFIEIEKCKVGELGGGGVFPREGAPALVILGMGFCELFARAGLEPQFS
jgi:hypothetical protein